MQVIVRVFILAGIAQIFSIVFGNTLHAQCTANAGPDVEACINGPSVTLPGGGTWSGSPLVTPAGVFTPSAEGSYTLTLTVTDGVCTDTDDIIAVVHPRPVTDAGPDQTICQGQTVNLCASATSANGAITLYTWSGGPVSNSLAQCPTATPAATTFYNVTAVDVEGCSDPDQITVFVLLPPAVNAGPDLTLCTTSGVVSLTGFSPAGG
ncbi:MAG: hypothetical protein JNM00_14770, partial [Flavobacteriales bacterium]|nr:hypothetical protein [Flavobacteriales bacterium]